MDHFGAAAAVLALSIAFGADLLLGDPRWVLHPVRFMGKTIMLLEKYLRPIFRGSTAGERASGIIILLIVSGGSFFVSFNILKYAAAFHLLLAFLLYIYLLYTLIAVKDMHVHVKDVLFALEQNELDLARKRVSFLVSRDTTSLSEESVVRGAMESLFENAADGVAAPLFYAAVGGVPLALFYKAVSTLDSMIGYKDKGYYYFGWAAARCDDVLSFIPARLTAMYFIISGKLMGISFKKAWNVLLEDRNKHSSPNSAWPEAAAAGVLNVRLGGSDIHSGLEVKKPLINEKGKAPETEDLKKGLLLFQVASLLAFGSAFLITIFSVFFLPFLWSFLL